MIGFICGLQTEAKCLQKASLEYCVYCTGGRLHRAELAAGRLIELGVCGMCSFGIAGGIEPSLRTGDVILADTVEFAERRFKVDEDWLLRLETAFKKRGLFPIIGTVVGGTRPIMTCPEKIQLYTQTKGLCVDLETGPLAYHAFSKGVPFTVVRVIADTASTDLPAAVLHGLSPTGQTKILPILKALLKRPSDLPHFLFLATTLTKALKKLRKLSVGLVPPRSFSEQ